MWNGKLKAVTFSFDDGNLEDKRLIELFNKYGVKGTFNLNSGSLCTSHAWSYELDGRKYTVHHLSAENIDKIYKGHEVACHTLQHPDLTNLTEEQVRNQICLDRRYLELLFGYHIDGFAYPFGTYNDTCIKVLKEAGFLYGRTVADTFGFDMPEEPLALKPTCHQENEKIFDVVDRFLSLGTDKPQMLYIWGHSYEFRDEKQWERIEKIISRLANHDDIFYGTNHEVLSDYYKENGEK